MLNSKTIWRMGKVLSNQFLIITFNNFLFADFCIFTARKSPTI